MAFQFSTTARNGMVDAITTAGGSAPVLEIRTGSAPADCAAEATGTLLASMNLPSTWMAAASAGAAAKSGTWQTGSAAGSGDAGYFRIIQGATCHIQGTATVTGGGGDMTLDSATITAGQIVSVTTFTLTGGGA